MAKTNIEIAQQTEEKFYFYLTALVFTLLGLSIQTASFGDSNFANILEIMGWLSFLLSGLAALSRLELCPNVYQSFDGLKKLKAHKDELLRMQKQGLKEVHVLEDNNTESIEVLLREEDEQINTLDAHIKKIQNSVTIRYQIHRWSFVIGLLLIISARAYLPISNMIKICK